MNASQHREYFQRDVNEAMVAKVSAYHLSAQVANIFVLYILATNTRSTAGFVSYHQHFLPQPNIAVGKSISIRMHRATETDDSFDTFYQHISHLISGIKDKEDLVRLLHSKDKAQDEGSEVIEINSLIFQPKGPINGDSMFAVVIVPSSNTVDIAKLSSTIALINSAYPKWELSPSHLVENLCGFKPGTVPPLGHLNCPSVVVIDKSLMTDGDILLLGGGGCLDYRCLIKSSFLVECTNAKIADIVKFDGQIINRAFSAKYGAACLEHRPKPFFQIAPPAADALFNFDSTALQIHRPVPVTAIGIITSVRQISKRLMFADFAPPDYPVDTSLTSYEKQIQHEKDMPWRSGEDGKDMYVQIIVGKTFCEQAGESDGSDKLKLLKPGRLVLIRGAANVDPKQKNGWDNSSGNWAQKRSLDVIISSFAILAEPNEVQQAVEDHMGTLGFLPWERKRQYEQRAVAGTQDHKECARNGKELMTQISSEPFLSLDQFNLHLQDTPLNVNIIDSIESITVMANDVTGLLSQIESASEKPKLLDFLLGVDCEWRPTGVYPGADSDQSHNHPVALMQISIPSLGQVYLVDTHTILRPNLAQSELMWPIEEVLSGTISTLFSSMAIIKVGYQVAIDFKRLAGSFPHIPAFRRVNSVVELSTLAKRLHPTSSLQSLGSLQRLTKLVLGYDISKEQQCSDWESRPLTHDQIEYATLDCALPPRLLDGMAEGAGTAQMTSVLLHCTSSWRFLPLDSDQKDAIRLLKAKRIIGDSFVVTQSWPSEDKVPAAPSIPEEGGGPYIDKSGIKRIPSHFVKINSTSKGQRNTWDEMVGKKVGKSKEKCVDLLTLKSIVEGARVEYNPRSGFVPFQDGLALFVNMPSSDRPSRVMPYPNEWLNKGQILTWYIRAKDWNEGQSNVANLLGFGESDTSPISTITLFVRVGNAEFIFCGKCTASLPPESEGNLFPAGKTNKKLIKLYLHLNDWNFTKDLTVMRQLVESQNSSNTISAANASADELGDIDLTAIQERIASMVIDGDVIGALGLAVDVSKTSTKKRSIATGMGCLQNILAQSDNAKILQAVEKLNNVLR